MKITEVSIPCALRTGNGFLAISLILCAVLFALSVVFKEITAIAVRGFWLTYIMDKDV